MANLGGFLATLGSLGKRQIRLVCLLLLLLIWFALPFTPYRYFHQAAIQEAGLRELIGGSALSELELKVEDRPPSRAMLQRLGDLEGRVPEVVNSGWPTHRRVCSVGKPRWLNALTVQLDAYSWEGPDASVRTVYILRLTPEGWKVIGQGETVVA